MSDQVGFGFQVDVVNTASLSHMLTGRVLKALSDGGVDTYALAAAFWLGAKVPVRTSLSDMVHFHISQRKNYQSVLSKALNIGWGHSTPVVEMTRTRAGSNALLVIGAFSTGCLPFQAAQCFSEFLTLSGLGPEMLPSTDVLKGLVTYLGPFVHDLGFSKVVQHVNDLAERAVRATVTARSGDLIDMKKRELDYLGRLSNLGTAPAVAAAIKQLMFSSRKGQKDYMILSIRGSWLVAFASHILGMSVNLRFNNRTVWASGGDHGDITFQLGARFEDTFSIQPSSEPLRVTAAADARRQYESQIAVEYFIEEALEAQSVRLPQLDPAIMESIHGAIRRFSFHILQILTSMDYLWESEAGDNAQGFFPFQMKFDSSAALNLILDTMRVGPTTEKAPRSLYFDPYAQDSETLKTDKNRYIYALSYMDSDSVQKVAARCQTHRQFASSLVELDRELFSVTGSAEAGCICRTVEKIVQGFAVSAVGLMQCKFEDFELRVQQSTIVGEIETDWSRKCVLLVNNPDKIDHIPTHHDFFDHLGQLVFPDYSRTWLRSRPMYASKRSYDVSRPGGSYLGLSGGAYTMFYSCIMQNDCYDELGRTMQIQTGRACVGGSFRNVILEQPENSNYYDKYGVRVENQIQPTWLDGGLHLEPHYRPPSTKLSMEVTVDETAIVLQLKLVAQASQVSSAQFMTCIHAFLTGRGWVFPRCEHPKETPYETKSDREIAIDGFCLDLCGRRSADGVMVFALQGNKLEQLLACAVMYKKLRAWSRFDGFDDDRERGGVFQIFACLGCCMRLAKEEDSVFPCLLMGGSE